MLMQRLIIILFLVIFIDANPIDQTIKQYKHRQRRNIDLMNWQSADVLFKQFYLNKNDHMEIDARLKRSENLSESRPVEGPINIEQLPAMLAARNVKRYPYSQRDDPAVIGR